MQEFLLLPSTNPGYRPSLQVQVNYFESEIWRSSTGKRAAEQLQLGAVFLGVGEILVAVS